MGSKKVGVIVSIVVLILILVSSVTVIVLIQNDVIPGFTSIDSEIKIKKDSDFLKYDFSGSGTVNDPYLIANLSFNTTKDCGIYIENTIKYFVITNCSISSVAASIIIDNIGYGTCTISSNTLIQLDGHGIYVENAGGITITNNTIYQTKPPAPYTGGSGIDLSYCSSMTTINNSVWNKRSGISFSLSSGQITNNYVYNCSRGIINGSISGNLVISNNTCFSCWFAFDLYYISGSTIQYNIIFNSSRGFQLVNCNDNIFVNNNISFCSGHAIYQFAYYPGGYQVNPYRNVFYYNIFYKNNYNETQFGASQVNDDLLDSIWYSETLLQGNYWSDLDWDPGITYSIDGAGNNTDLYPLETPL
ncbi:MAG: NosD domain-containing protein [Candidatus Heimdallarchaeota archaeon]